MSGRAPTPQGGDRPRLNGRLGLGMLLIATGRPAGFTQFGATAQAYLASLAPWLALAIVLGGTLAVSGRPGLGLAFFLVALCNLLAPAVIADAFCRLWDRRQLWALYANVLNCAQWAFLGVLVLLLPVATMAVAAGLSQDGAARLLLAGLVAYGLWFHWFAARHALQLTRGRAALVMLGVVFGTALLVQAPTLLSGRRAAHAPDAAGAPHDAGKPATPPQAAH